MTKLHKVPESWSNRRLHSAALLTNEALGSASRRIPLFGQFETGPSITINLHHYWAF
jgi:hypothetical protein